LLLVLHVAVLRGHHVASRRIAPNLPHGMARSQQRSRMEVGAAWHACMAWRCMLDPDLPRRAMPHVSQLQYVLLPRDQRGGAGETRGGWYCCATWVVFLLTEPVQRAALCTREPQPTRENLYVGGVVTVFARQLKIIGLGDPYTKRQLEAKSERCGRGEGGASTGRGRHAHAMRAPMPACVCVPHSCTPRSTLPSVPHSRIPLPLPLPFTTGRSP